MEAKIEISKKNLLNCLRALNELEVMSSKKVQEIQFGLVEGIYQNNNQNYRVLVSAGLLVSDTQVT